MDYVKEICWADPRSWSTTLASLLPLWLLSLVVMAVGFPRAPISIEVAKTSFVLAITASIVLLLKRWMTIELLLYSHFPFLLLSTFDEISSTYKTPFIILCALILTAGVIGYQRRSSTRLGRGLILLFIAVVTFVIAWDATLSSWRMADDLSYVRCFSDYQGCTPLTGRETPCWILFFSC